MISHPVPIEIAERGRWPMKQMVEEALAINRSTEIILEGEESGEQLRVEVALAYVSCEGLYAYIYKKRSFLSKWLPLIVTFLMCGLVSLPAWSAGVGYGLLGWLIPPALVTVLILSLRHHHKKGWQEARAAVEENLLRLREKLEKDPNAL